jgi:ABC-type multidrug transport system ATPase subunit
MGKFFDGSLWNAGTKRNIGYVMQDATFFLNLTVRDTLDFTAAIRLSDFICKEQLRERILYVMPRLHLENCQNTRIRDQQFDKGLNGGYRKRVNIANELLADPCLLLLDDPTGLDASTAMLYTNPPALCLAFFDELMVLSEDKVSYFGLAAGA